jgi:hypothetical protein
MSSPHRQVQHYHSERSEESPRATTRRGFLLRRNDIARHSELNEESPCMITRRDSSCVGMTSPVTLSAAKSLLV